MGNKVGNKERINSEIDADLKLQAQVAAKLERKTFGQWLEVVIRAALKKGQKEHSQE